MRWLARSLVAVALAWPMALSAQPTQVTVFAAASLKNGLDAVAAEFQRETGDRVAISYGASSALARQIEQGAPADLFISADLDWMDYLEQKNLIRRERPAQSSRQPHRARRAGRQGAAAGA